MFDTSYLPDSDDLAPAVPASAALRASKGVEPALQHADNLPYGIPSGLDPRFAGTSTASARQDARSAIPVAYAGSHPADFRKWHGRHQPTEQHPVGLATCDDSAGDDDSAYDRIDDETCYDRPPRDDFHQSGWHGSSSASGIFPGRFPSDRATARVRRRIGVDTGNGDSDEGIYP